MKLAFVVFDIENKIIRRFNLDLVTGLEGVGFKFKFSTIESDIESIITKVVQEKQDIKFDIHFINRAYEKSAALDQWILDHTRIENRMGIEYDDGVTKRYLEGKVKELTKTERDQFGQLVRRCVFMPITPFFPYIEDSIRIQVSSWGKSYPYRYPYSYGRHLILNNEINNTYLSDIPITVRVNGAIYEPIIRLLDENNEVYNTVRFPTLTLQDDDFLIINSFVRKIWLYRPAGGLQDYSAYTDPTFDTFLMARAGKSTISINLEPTDTGNLMGNWRPFRL